jgi:hypothetical protein
MKGDALHPKSLQDGDKIPCHGFPSFVIELVHYCNSFCLFLVLVSCYNSSFPFLHFSSCKLVIHVEPNSFDMHKVLLWNHGIVIILIDLKY